MKTKGGWVHLLSAGFLGAMLSASAFAGPVMYRESTNSQPHQAQDMATQKTIKVYIMTSASAIPKPISYLIGGVVTTAVPVEIIGRGDTVSR